MNNGKQEAQNLMPQDVSLASLVIELRSEKDLALPRTTGHNVHAAFLELVGQTDPRLASSLHSSDREKPFTLSWLKGRLVFDNGLRLLRRDETYWFRVTGFSEAVIKCLVNWLERPPQIVRLFNENLSVVRLTAEDHPAAGLSGFKSLYHGVMDLKQEVPRELTLRFLTPTTFRTGDYNTLFPIPRLVFYSLAQKWNEYAPIHLGDMVHRLIDETVIVSRHRLRTQMLEFDDYRQIGFMGETTFRISDLAPDMLVRMIRLLADFAFYAGVGYKTTIGMGQVQKVPMEL